MKALITGAHGTVGSALVAELRNQDETVVTWDRAQVPIDDYHAMEAFVKSVQPDVLYHLAVASKPTGRPNEVWLVNYDWASELAWICRILQIRFVFTSTVMVFTDQARGPFTTESQPDATEGYGGTKRRAEERVFYQNPKAVVARLGWQIGHASGGNQMIDFLHRQMEDRGRIEASTRWYPACSFLDDTAMVLHHLANMEPGLYQIDSNRQWTFFDIATALKARHGHAWKIVPTNDFVYDQRMLDARLNVPSLRSRLPQLSAQ